MSVWPETGDVATIGTEPYTHARIGHANNWHAGTMAASTTDADYFETGPDTSLTYEKWKPTALPATLEVDFSAAKTVNYCGIAAHTLGTNACTIAVEYWDGAAWVALTISYLQDSNGDVVYTTGGDPITFDSGLILDDQPIMVFFPDVSVSKMRVRVVSGDDYPKIGVLKFGVALEMPQPIYGGHVPLDLTRRTVMRTTESETGEFLGKTKLRVNQGTSFSWSHLKADWIRDNWKSLQLAIETDPFFIAWRPESFSSAGFCDAKGTPEPVNMGVKTYMQVDLEVRGYGYD